MRFKIVLLAFILSTLASGQDFYIDSLKKQLPFTSGEKKAELLLNLATETSSHDVEESMRYLGEATLLFNKFNNTQKLGYCHYVYSNNFEYLGDYIQAMENGLKALDIAQSFNDTKLKNNALICIGNIHLALRENESALEAFNRALNESPNLDDATKSYLFNNIGIVYGENKNLDKALEYYNLSVQIKEKLNDKFGLGSGYSNIGEIYLMKNDVSKAILYFSKSLALRKETGNKGGILYGYYHMADVYIKLKKFDIAEKYVDSTLQIASEIKRFEMLAYGYRKKADVLNQQNQFQNAYSFLNKYIEITDTLFSAQSRKKINALNIAYQTKEKDNAIKFLNKEQLLKQEQIKGQRRLILVLAFLLVLSIVLVIAFYQQFVKRKKANLQVLQKNKELMESDEALRFAYNKLNSEFEELKEASSENKTKTSNEIKKEIKDEIITKINDFFATSDEYLNNEFSLGHLGEITGYNRSYVSLIINQYMNTSFTTLVNNYRIEKAKNMLLNDANAKFTIEHIGQTVGFKSKSTFIRAFKDNTGTTPALYAKTSKNKSLI